MFACASSCRPCSRSPCSTCRWDTCSAGRCPGSSWGTRTCSRSRSRSSCCCLPVVFVNFKFFRVGFKTLVHGAPNMDSLIALGSTAASAYGIYAIYKIGIALGAGDLHASHMAAMDLYFESAAMILTLITLGKYFEARAKGKTTGAIAKLVDLAPKEAVRLADGVEERVPVEAVRVGDVLAVRAGEGVPVDGTLLEGSGTLDESVITGESVPVDKRPGDTRDRRHPEQHRMVHYARRPRGRRHRAGRHHPARGRGHLHEGSHREDRRQDIGRVRARGHRHRRGHVRRVDARWRDAGGYALSHAISVLVISLPVRARPGHARRPSWWAPGTGATNGILVKSAEALETAHDVHTVVLDKTGTITEGAPSVTDVLPGAGRGRRSGCWSWRLSVEGRSRAPARARRVRLRAASEQVYPLLRGGLQADSRRRRRPRSWTTSPRWPATWRMMEAPRHRDGHVRRGRRASWPTRARRHLFFAQDGELSGHRRRGRHGEALERRRLGRAEAAWASAR